MIELFISMMICIALIAKLKIFIKCNKYRGNCGKKDCCMKYYCDKYNNGREIADFRMKHLKKTIETKLFK